MEARSPLAAILAFALSSWLPTQQPTPTGPRAEPQRLVYELPLDAMQRTLRNHPEGNLERMLDDAIEVVRARAGAGFEVRRVGAIGFGVTVPHERAAEIPELRAALELQGTLEFRMVARAGTEAAFDLVAERTRLQQWLDAGGRERVLTSPRSLDAFHDDRQNGPLAAGKLRWVVHRIAVDEANPDRWRPPLGLQARLQPACVALYTDDDYSAGQVPAGLRKRANAELIELIALDLHQRGFDQGDIDPLRIDCKKTEWGPALGYALRPPAAKDYADWSEQNIGETSAILWNGEIVVAPTFSSRIQGTGMISGAFTPAEVERMAKTLRSGALPAPPKFLRQETVTEPR